MIDFTDSQSKESKENSPKTYVSFFRHIKYDCGASGMKCKKEEYSKQELNGHFITSAAVWKIINGIVLEKNILSVNEFIMN